MSKELEKLDYDALIKKGTGNHGVEEDYKIVVFPFDRYEITIKLSQDNKFCDILEVKINEDFRSYKQKIASRGFHDVEKFYVEKEPI